MRHSVAGARQIPLLEQKQSRSMATFWGKNGLKSNKVGEKNRAGWLESIIVPREVRDLVMHLAAGRKLRREAFDYYRNAIGASVWGCLVSLLLFGGITVAFFVTIDGRAEEYYVFVFLLALAVVGVFLVYYYPRSMFVRTFYVCSVGLPTRAYIRSKTIDHGIRFRYRYKIGDKYLFGLSDPTTKKNRENYKNRKLFRVYYLKGREKISCLVDDYWMSRYCLDIDQYKKWQKEAFG